MTEITNAYRGDVKASLGGKERLFRLTLGSLAELEAHFQVSTLSDLVERLSSGELSSRDTLAILAAGLCGAGENVTKDDVAQMACPQGAAGYAAIATKLLLATFSPVEKQNEEGQTTPPFVKPEAVKG